MSQTSRLGCCAQRILRNGKGGHATVLTRPSPNPIKKSLPFFLKHRRQFSGSGFGLNSATKRSKTPSGGGHRTRKALPLTACWTGSLCLKRDRRKVCLPTTRATCPPSTVVSGTQVAQRSKTVVLTRRAKTDESMKVGFRVPCPRVAWAWASCLTDGKQWTEVRIRPRLPWIYCVLVILGSATTPAVWVLPLAPSLALAATRPKLRFRELELGTLHLG